MNKLLLTTALLFVMGAPAHAALASFCGPSSGMGCEAPGDEMVFLNKAKGVTFGTGRIGSPLSTQIMDITSDNGALNIEIDLANGFATITPAHGFSTFNGLDISIPGFDFKMLVFDEQLTPVAGQSSDPFTITDHDTLGTLVGNETDAADTDKEFSTTALLGAFKDVNIQAAGGFDEIKHIEVGGLIAVPEPQTWVMLLVGFGFMAWGAATRKRLRTFY